VVSHSHIIIKQVPWFKSSSLLRIDLQKQSRGQAKEAWVWIDNALREKHKSFISEMRVEIVP